MLYKEKNYIFTHIVLMHWLYKHVPAWTEKTSLVALHSINVQVAVGLGNRKISFPFPPLKLTSDTVSSKKKLPVC
jgi:hypothetical protein